MREVGQWSRGKGLSIRWRHKLNFRALRGGKFEKFKALPRTTPVCWLRVKEVAVTEKAPPDKKIKKKRSFFKYTLDEKAAALQSIRKGRNNVLEASREFKVPETTLRDAIAGRTPENKAKTGPPTILTEAEENTIVNWCINLTKSGFPLKIDDLKNTVAEIIKDDGRITPFTNGRPGKKWCSLFLRRHPNISFRTAEGISKGRAVVTEESIRKWFRELIQFMTERNLMSIFLDARRILNGDETAFCLCPKTGKVIRPKGWKNIYINQQGNEKETITILIVVAADGEIAPPMVVYPYIRPPKDVIEDMPTDWILGKTESGWMTIKCFYEYICNDFNSWLIRKNIPKPVILFVDGHKSHLTMQLSKFCDENGIILYCLPPNATHVMQPEDVSVFKPLKSCWKDTIRMWQMKPENINNCLTKATFAPLVSETLDRISLTSAIKNGFRVCGLYPLHPDVVDYTKCVKNHLEKVVGSFNLLTQITVNKETLDFAENLMKTLEPRFEEKGINVQQIVNTLREVKLELSNSPLGQKSQFFEENSEVLFEATTSPSTVLQTLVLESTVNENLLNDSGFSLAEPIVINVIQEDQIFERVEEELDSLIVQKGPLISSSSYSNQILRKESSLSKAFSNHLFYPEISNKSQKSKEQPPSAVSSQSWRNYLKEKELKSIELEKQKGARKIERMKKKANKENIRKQEAAERQIKRRKVMKIKQEKIDKPKKRGRPKKL